MAYVHLTPLVDDISGLLPGPVIGSRIDSKSAYIMKGAFSWNWPSVYSTIGCCMAFLYEQPRCSHNIFNVHLWIAHSDIPANNSCKNVEISHVCYS